eukprot:scaffold660959_cov50-Prasinocladus_malaysianus.AAC.1
MDKQKGKYEVPKRCLYHPEKTFIAALRVCISRWDSLGTWHVQPGPGQVGLKGAGELLALFGVQCSRGLLGAGPQQRVVRRPVVITRAVPTGPPPSQ